MNRQRVNNIGVLVEERVRREEETPLGDYAVSHLLGGIAVAADRVGARFTVQIYRPGMDEQLVFGWLENREIDGLIYYGFGMPPAWLTRFRTENYPVVGVSIDPAQGVPCVNVDNFGAMRGLTDHLLRRGRRRMLFLHGNPESYPDRERFRGFRAALEAAGIVWNRDNEEIADFDTVMAEQTVLRRFAAGCAFDAVICASDDMALGVLSALRKLGLDVPGQVAVTGADDTRTGRFVTPALTTFDYRTEQQGQAAFELLSRCIAAPATPPENPVLPTIPIFRASSDCPLRP